MQKDFESTRRSDCPLSVSLDMFGDRWSLLIIRDLMFKDRHEFRDFLGAEEGIATNVLSDRLRRLEGHGIVARAPHPFDARKVHYRLTKKGLDLAPVLIEMIIWAATHEKTAAPPSVTLRMMRDRRGVIAELRAEHERSIKQQGSRRHHRDG
jgi:DNA-binding HxlR family transcriptional regulator